MKTTAGACDRLSAGKPGGRRPLGRLGRIWKDEIERDLKEFGWGVVKLIRLAQEGD
jgi:hypothetical protein